MYRTENVFTFENQSYERLYDCEHKYRLILSEDDYDYVEDVMLIRRLDVVFEKLIVSIPMTIQMSRREYEMLRSENQCEVDDYITDLIQNETDKLDQ
jgi:hypothetical protein